MLASGDALAGPRVGDEVVGLFLERFLQNHRVVEPDDDAAHVASLHRGGEEIGAGLLKGRGDGDSPVEMAGARLEVQVPAGDRASDVLFLIHHHQPGADVADIELLPVELFGPG